MEDGCTGILLAMAFPVERAALKDMVDDHPRFRIVGEASQGSAALEIAVKTRPDIIAVGDCLTDMGNLALAHFLSRRVPQASILLCCAEVDEQFVVEAIREGARGFISRSRLAQNLIEALDALADHRPYWDEVVKEDVFTSLMGKRPTEPVPLTGREEQILAFVARGHSSLEIALKLGIDRKTVDTHRLNLRRKLKLRTVPDVVRYAIERGFIRA